MCSNWKLSEFQRRHKRKRRHRFLQKNDLITIQRNLPAAKNNTQAFIQCNRYYACMFLQSNHFLTSSVRSPDKEPLPSPSALSHNQSSYCHLPALLHLFHLRLIHLSSPLHHREVGGRRTLFNQTIWTPKKGFSLASFLILPPSRCLGLCGRQSHKKSLWWVSSRGQRSCYVENSTKGQEREGKVRRGEGSTRQERTDEGWRGREGQLEEGRSVPNREHLSAESAQVLLLALQSGVSGVWGITGVCRRPDDGDNWWSEAVRASDSRSRLWKRSSPFDSVFERERERLFPRVTPLQGQNHRQRDNRLNI